VASVDLDEVRALLRRERRGSDPEDAHVERLPKVTRTSPASSWHQVGYSDLDEESADAEIAAQVSHFASLGVEFEWKVFSDDRPADLRDRLVRHGFEVGPLEAVVVYDLQAGLAPLAQESGCSVRRVSSPAEVRDYRAVSEAVFGHDFEGLAAELEEALARANTGHLGYVGYVDGEAASVGRLLTNPRSAMGGLYGGGTLARFRGRGCYRALIAARARDAKAMGARYLSVDALPTSLPILTRLGFRHLLDTWPCVRTPAPTAPAPSG
jgi:hypothetical protein